MTSPTLSRLQAEHPEWCIVCGWPWKQECIDVGHLSSDAPSRALIAAITDLDAQLAEREAQLLLADEVLLGLDRGDSNLIFPDHAAVADFNRAIDAALTREEARQSAKSALYQAQDQSTKDAQ